MAQVLGSLKEGKLVWGKIYRYDLIQQDVVCIKETVDCDGACQFANKDGDTLYICAGDVFKKPYIFPGVGDIVQVTRNRNLQDCEDGSPRMEDVNLIGTVEEVCEEDATYLPEFTIKICGGSTLKAIFDGEYKILKSFLNEVCADE